MLKFLLSIYLTLIISGALKRTAITKGMISPTVFKSVVEYARFETSRDTVTILGSSWSDPNLNK
jgi:hypothetical protein